MTFTGRDLMVAAGYKRYGEEFSKALTPVAGSWGWARGGAGFSMKEPFAGAWQMNVEEKQCDILCYPTLYACLSRISRDIGTLPFLLQQEDSSGIWNNVDNPAYSPVLRKPNHYQTAQQFREAWALSLLIHGNTYVLKQRDERNVVVKLYVLDPCRVMPMVAETGDVFYQLNYPTADNLLPNTYPGEQIIVPAREIIHDRLNTFHHQLIGVPPLCAAYWPVVKNLKILKNAASYFANGANPGGILTAPAGMTEANAEEVKNYWNTNFSGTNSGKVAVIGADMKFTSFAFKSSDSQLVEQLRYSDEQICQPFGVPPFIVGIGSIPAGMKVDDMMGMYERLALGPIIDGMETQLEEGLSISWPLGIEMDTDPLLRMDPQKRAEVWGKMGSDGLATPNEGRRRFNLRPLEGGDTVYKQMQDLPLAEAAKNTVQPKEAPAPEPDPDPEPTEEDQERAIITAINKAFERAAA
jgi:HK97 family phage portal protein